MRRPGVSDPRRSPGHLQRTPHPSRPFRAAVDAPATHVATQSHARGLPRHGLGLVITKWPEFLAHEPWELMHGTVLAMLVAMSVLALVGQRYPQQMLPVLLFEVGWKALWLGGVALPLWLDDNLTGATRAQTIKVLWVIIVIAVIPWRHAFRQFVLASSER